MGCCGFGNTLHRKEEEHSDHRPLNAHCNYGRHAPNSCRLSALGRTHRNGYQEQAWLLECNRRDRRHAHRVSKIVPGLVEVGVVRLPAARIDRVHIFTGKHSDITYQRRLSGFYCRAGNAIDPRLSRNHPLRARTRTERHEPLKAGDVCRLRRAESAVAFALIPLSEEETPVVEGVTP